MYNDVRSTIRNCSTELEVEVEAKLFPTESRMYVAALVDGYKY